jgi:hypothetical protein
MERVEKEGMQGCGDPKVANKVAERPGLEMLTEAGRKNAEHAGQVADWKVIAGDKK